MLFKRLIFDNYKTYYGTQDIDLYIPPGTFEKSGMNIILIGGLNGAGKTTFLKAILYILFGKRGLSKDEYDKLKSNIINNKFFDEGGREASIQLNIETDKGEEWQIKVKWHFDKFKKVSHEERDLIIIKDKNSIPKHHDVNDISAFNKLIDRIIPYYAAPFFIFDGEEIRNLITKQDRSEMKDTIHKITGMNANRELISDLELLQRDLENKIAKASNSVEISKIQETLSDVQEKLDKYYQQQNLVNNKIQKVKDEILHFQSVRREKLLNNSKSRDTIIKKHSGLEVQLQNARVELDAYLSEHLQMLVLSKKLEKLKRHLKEEKKVREKKLTFEASLVPYKKFINQLLTHPINPPLSKDQLTQIEGFGKQIWMKENAIEDINNSIIEIHDLTSKDFNTILNTPIKDKYQLQQLINNISRLEQEFEQLEKELQSAPEALDVVEEDRKLDELKKKLGEYEAKQLTITRQLAKYNDEKKNLDSQISKKASNVTNVDEAFEELEYVKRSILALRKYEQEYTLYKAKQIKTEFETMLKRLFRKEDEFGNIEFDLTTFTIKLYNDRLQEISIKDRSAGEMQIISSALIWALTKASNLQLPVVIDTPLGRLDSQHRKHLVEHYYKEISEQVIILSTDTEITSDYAETMKAASYKQYLLDYHKEYKYTTIRDGYFEFVKG